MKKHTAESPNVHKYSTSPTNITDRENSEKIVLVSNLKISQSNNGMLWKFQDLRWLCMQKQFWLCSVMLVWALFGLFVFDPVPEYRDKLRLLCLRKGDSHFLPMFYIDLAGLYLYSLTTPMSHFHQTPNSSKKNKSINVNKDHQIAC